MEGQTCSQNASNPLSREAGRHSLSLWLYPPPDSLPRFRCGGGGAVRGEEGEDTGFEQEGGNLPDVSYQGSPGVCQAF